MVFNGMLRRSRSLRRFARCRNVAARCALGFRVAENLIEHAWAADRNSGGGKGGRAERAPFRTWLLSKSPVTGWEGAIAQGGMGIVYWACAAAQLKASLRV